MSVQLLMPNPSPRRPARRLIQEVPGTSPDVPAAREPRGARRKRETRSRLLMAALRLMAEKGMEGVAINEITEAADVGFGSFYNHFESKEAIYAALTDWVFEDFVDEVDRAIGGLSDPAQVMSVSVRQTLLRAWQEPIWGELLIREGFCARDLNRRLGSRLLSDIRRGIATKRFVIADPLMSFISACGTILAAIALELRFAAACGLQASALRDLGFSGEHVPERTAAILLQSLGLPRSEAEEIAHRPFPGVALPPPPDGLRGRSAVLHCVSTRLRSALAIAACMRDCTTHAAVCVVAPAGRIMTIRLQNP